MQIAARSYLTAGVAMVGATALIASPISPSAPQDIKVPAIYAAEVALTAGFDPITPYVDFFTTAVNNVGLIGQAWLAQPAPILSQIVANQRGYAEKIITILQGSVDGFTAWASTVPETIQMAMDELKAGNFGLAIGQVMSLPIGLAIYAGFPLLSLFDIPTAMSQNFANVVAKLPIALRVLGFNAVNIWGGFAQIGYSVIDPLAAAVKDGDIGQAISIILSAPAVIADAVINDGILKPGPFSPGLLYNLINFIPRMIAAAIKPAPPEPEFFNTVAGLPSASAQLVSLNAGSTPAEASAGQTPTEGTSGEAAQPAPAPDSETGTATEEEAPETETPATDETDGTDESEGSEETTDTDETEDSTGSDDSEDSESPNGSTDLSGGNKAEPGTTGSGTNTGSGTGSGSGSTDESATPTNPTTGTNTGSTGSNTNDSDNDAGGSNDSSDSGSDS